MDVITDGKISGKISGDSALRPKRSRHVAVAAAGEPVIQRTSERSTACHRHRDFLTYLQGIALPFPWNRAYSAGAFRIQKLNRTPNWRGLPTVANHAGSDSVHENVAYTYYPLVN